MFKTRIKSQDLIAKSESIVDVFISAIVQLDDVNELIDVENDILFHKQEAIQAERTALGESKANNDKISMKIKSFFD